jgi:Rrf2 family protein
MRLRFSRTADYGLRAALEIAATSDGALVSRRELARATSAPASVLAQSLALLVRAGLLAAQAGPRGGYRLARPAEQLSVYDIVVAIDGADHEDRCVLNENVCSWTGACPFHSFLVAAQELFLDSLRATSLADVSTKGASVPAASHGGAAG